jgi:hypothetical protein
MMQPYGGLGGKGVSVFRGRMPKGDLDKVILVEVVVTVYSVGHDRRRKGKGWDVIDLQVQRFVCVREWGTFHDPGTVVYCG